MYQQKKIKQTLKCCQLKCSRMLASGWQKKLLLYWNLSGNVLTGTRTIFLIPAWKIKLSLLQSTLVQLHLSEWVFLLFNEKAALQSYLIFICLVCYVWGFSAGIQGARKSFLSQSNVPKYQKNEEKDLSTYIPWLPWIQSYLSKKNSKTIKSLTQSTFTIMYQHIHQQYRRITSGATDFPQQIPYVIGFKIQVFGIP